MRMLSKESNTGPVYPPITQRIAGMALEAIQNPHAALADLARPSEQHNVSDHLRGAYAAVLDAIGLKPTDVR